MRGQINVVTLDSGLLELSQTFKLRGPNMIYFKESNMSGVCSRVLSYTSHITLSII